MSNHVRPRPVAADRRRRLQKLPSRRRPALRLAPGRPRRLALAALGLLLVAVTAVWVLWPEPEPRQREYLNVTACLLTDRSGISGDSAKPVWAAMQEASVSSLVKVQYLAVNGPQTVDNARSHVASLAGSQCGLVIAAGPAQIDAVVAAAPTFPQVRFITVGGSAAAANVTAIDAKDAGGLRKMLKQEVIALADAAS
ncbi:hypothetical protein GCM10010169_48820 [Micromonospora fulviviridis]|uniref:hypothetical protein n=1 Tax=Micromonospora fulviviridis TaxID=47860 RepID=UPI001669B9C5|nr:hypothetical protein [Micromonospora fulviviridis]GGR98466.1 hypothetical protein GCM10010169_48820 [Micromonospora fulviviridis]